MKCKKMGMSSEKSLLWEKTRPCSMMWLLAFTVGITLFCEEA